MSVSSTETAATKKRSQTGFTLIEVLIAMTILSIGILGIAQMQIMAIGGNDTAGSTTVALNLAQQQLENIINADYDDLVDANPANNADLTSIANVDYQNVDVEGNAVDFGKYDLIWNVADSTPITNVKTVVVIVSWQNGRHRRILTHIKALAD